ncbi:MAG: hypothetical protein RIF44_14500 [Nitratireductor sp.]
MRDAHHDAELALFEQGLGVFSEFPADQGIDLLVQGPLPFLREAKCEPSAAAPQWFAPNGAASIYYSQETTLGRQRR